MTKVALVHFWLVTDWCLLTYMFQMLYCNYCPHWCYRMMTHKPSSRWFLMAAQALLPNRLQPSHCMCADSTHPCHTLGDHHHPPSRSMCADSTHHYYALRLFQFSASSNDSYHCQWQGKGPTEISWFQLRCSACWGPWSILPCYPQSPGRCLWNLVCILIGCTFLPLILLFLPLILSQAVHISIFPQCQLHVIQPLQVPWRQSDLHAQIHWSQRSAVATLSG